MHKDDVPAGTDWCKQSDMRPPLPTPAPSTPAPSKPQDIRSAFDDLFKTDDDED